MIAEAPARRIGTHLSKGNRRQDEGESRWAAWAVSSDTEAGGLVSAADQLQIAQLGHFLLS